MTTAELKFLKKCNFLIEKFFIKLLNLLNKLNLFTLSENTNMNTNVRAKIFLRNQCSRSKSNIFISYSRNCWPFSE